MVADAHKVSIEVNASAPYEARSALRELVPECFLADAQLLVSELVANVVKHASPRNDELTLVASWRDGTLRVEVFQEGRMPRLTASSTSSDRESGRGLQLVDEVAARWGVARRPSPCVWFELDAPAAES